MKKFFVSKNENERIEYINKIEGKKICIYNKKTELIDFFDYSVDMNKLMNNDYFLEKILLCDANTTIVLVDVLIKNGIYVHPYGKIFRFTEIAKETLIIDSFMFRYNEKNIVRPFLFIDTSIFGSSMIGFHHGDNKIENYYLQIKKYIDCRVKPIDVHIIKYSPTKSDIDKYEYLKKELIENKDNTKPKIVNALISYVDELDVKKKENIIIPKSNELIVYSNKQKNKFNIYNSLSNDKINKVYFFSSGIFGADEIQLNQSMNAILRHNKLIKLINE